VITVGLFVDRFPVLSETFVANEALALARIGHEVSVEARRRPDNPATPLGLDIPVHYAAEESRGERLRALAWLVLRHPLRTAVDVIGRLSRPTRDRGTKTRRLAIRARRLSRLGPLHIHTHFASTMADDAHRVARLLGVPGSVTAHAWDIYISPRRLRERLVRSDFVTSGCDYTVAELERVMGPDGTGKAFKQVMGVDHESFRRSSPLPGTRHVVGVGRLVEKKGFVHLVQAAAALPDVVVSIAGDGPERERLEREIGRQGVADRVSLLGASGPAQVRELLERADVLCMPCVVAPNGDRDSMPVVVKEAMAMELCIVASDEVGLPELVQPPWGRLAPPHDPEALAAAITDVLSLGKAERADAGRAGRTFVVEHADVNSETLKLSDRIERCRVERRR
jgi:colanic acid/amylovoran biosynthesis glycosyltransferase